MDLDYAALGKRVRTHRKLQRMTQEDLAQQVGISHSFLGHIERGTRKMSLETLVGLANVLQVSCDALLQDSLKQELPVTNLELNEQQKTLLTGIAELIKGSDLR